MPEMTDPMKALVALQNAIDSRRVALRPCEVYSNLGMFMDEPGGTLRITYANVAVGKVQAVALFAMTEPVDGVPCFQLGYAVIESMRQRGLAAEIVAKGMQELRNGLMRNGAKKFYVEAIVAVSNAPSNKLARRLLSDSPEKCDDKFSGESSFQYLKLIE